MDFYFEVETSRHCPILGFILSTDTECLYGVQLILKDNQDVTSTCTPTSLHLTARRQLEAYLSGRLKSFDLPLRQQGTDFQRSVWAEIAAIPFGQTATYGELAVRLGDAHLARAVGQAANKNPLPVVIPCHRVVGGRGKLIGFASGVATKAFLLDHEKGNIL